MPATRRRVAAGHRPGKAGGRAAAGLRRPRRRHRGVQPQPARAHQPRARRRLRAAELRARGPVSQEGTPHRDAPPLEATAVRVDSRGRVHLHTESRRDHLDGGLPQVPRRRDPRHGRAHWLRVRGAMGGQRVALRRESLDRGAARRDLMTPLVSFRTGSCRLGGEDVRRGAPPAGTGGAAARTVRPPPPPGAPGGPAPGWGRPPRGGGRPADPALRRAVRRAGPGHPRRAAAPVPRAATGDRQDGDLRDARRPRGTAGGHAHRAAARRPAGGPGRAGRVSPRAGGRGPRVSRLPRHPGDARMTAELAREMAELTVEHLVLVAVSMAVAIAVALPAGILMTRRAPLQRWVLGFANVMQTVPSLALFGFLIPIPLLGGIGQHTAIVALVVYALLPVLRDTLAGILGVDRAVRESAIAMGMTGRQLLWEVELPLAARTILAGVRVATVTTIGTATIAAAIGGGGLGVFIFQGLASVDTAQILAGAVPAALLAHHALVKGDLALYPEYTGTALTAILKLPLSSDPDAVFAKVKAEYLARFNVHWLDPLGFNNTFAMVIRGADARKYQIESLSDAARHANGWTLGVGYEFQRRRDGLAGLLKTYKLPLKRRPHPMDLGLLYKALEQKQVDMVAANATDGLLSVLDVKILKDDKRYFPPYQASLAVRADALAKHPPLKRTLEQLSGLFSDEIMRTLNYQVDGKHLPVSEVAITFLRASKLLA